MYVEGGFAVSYLMKPHSNLRWEAEGGASRTCAQDKLPKQLKHTQNTGPPSDLRCQEIMHGRDWEGPFNPRNTRMPRCQPHFPYWEVARQVRSQEG